MNLRRRPCLVKLWGFYHIDWREREELDDDFIEWVPISLVEQVREIQLRFAPGEILPCYIEVSRFIETYLKVDKYKSKPNWRKEGF